MATCFKYQVDQGIESVLSIVPRKSHSRNIHYTTYHSGMQAYKYFPFFYSDIFYTIQNSDSITSLETHEQGC